MDVQAIIHLLRRMPVEKRERELETLERVLIPDIWQAILKEWKAYENR